ncbi:hypothetical protein QTH97_30790 [Variovorax sp. J22R24]|uniref:hypothetical protein n=1 Tax=Variovorax gracilis TaxID=3053502 RepID=UPI0025757A67|nr:hypothetical protein [Variovorax sp. J22R24]MDM0109351.1 hypothetical protein [Variovorax sp. J22R24]
MLQSLPMVASRSKTRRLICAHRTTAEVGRTVATALRTSTLSPEDSRYSNQLVAQRTGLSQQDAEKRVNKVYTRDTTTLEDTKTEAKAMADSARKATADGSLWLFMSLEGWGP